MAELAVSLAIDKLNRIISDEANLPHGFYTEFEEIYFEIQHIIDLVSEADRRAAEGDHRSERIKIWVKPLSEASMRMENVIDQYMIYTEQKPRGRGCVTSLYKVFCSIRTLKLRHQLASEIQKIKSDFDEIRRRDKVYNFLSYPSLEPESDSRSVQLHELQMPARYLDEDEFVGFEGPKDELIGWLVEGPGERSVISVVGMGGLGKTTLVRQVFNNPNVKTYFEVRAWISVSRSYTVERLMRDLFVRLYKEENMNTPEGISEMDLDSLIDEVRNHLHQKRYVVVFDDVWSVEFWYLIERAMLDNKNGSRILITTRKKDVVRSCTRSYFNQVHELKPLSQEESMELLCKKAFGFHHNEPCPKNLRKISSYFVEKLEGLPLAIVAVGDLVYNYLETPSAWEGVWRLRTSEMDQYFSLDAIYEVFYFSYDDLPSHLKSCLLFFGIYPEGYEVKSTRLIRHWIAEGLVKDEGGKTLENIAQQYLTDLIDSSLVQVSSFTTDDRAKSCRVPYLLHRVIIKKFKEFSFCQRVSKEDESCQRVSKEDESCQRVSKEDESLSSGMFPRLSIATISNDLMGSSESSCTRSLFLFADENSALINKFVQIIPTKYRLLKVLDFENSRMHSIPESWRNLTQLKYLSLRDAWYLSRKLPKFIGKLQKLETLDIRGTDVREMPKDICKLRKLRHLLGNDMTLFELKNGLGGMTSLQTLRHVNLTMDEYDDDGIELIRELGMLKQLRNLGLTGVKEEQGSALCSSINAMTNLEKLSINSNEDEVIDLPDTLSLPLLHKLCLNGMLKEIPEWGPRLQNLVTLTLRESKLTNDPLESLKNMPHLLFLVMNRAYEGKSLHFKHGWFQQLRGLFLGPLDNLESIIIEEGALCSLEKLELSRIPELKTVPHGIQHLKKLEVVDIFAMSNEFNQCIAPQGEPENLIIQHVPLVKITSNFGERTRVIHHSSWRYKS